MATDTMTAHGTSKLAERAIAFVKRRKEHSVRRRTANAAHKSNPNAEQHRLAGKQRVLAATAGGAPKIIRIPITNVYDLSDYSAALSIGSGNAVANVILDTGSSTLAVEPSAYEGSGDTDRKSTAYAQLVQYGTGGWAGPVVTTNVTIGGPGNNVTLNDCYTAITEVQEPGNFEGLTGILGLAYNGMNTAFDFGNYFTQHRKPATTYPWPFGGGSWNTFLERFKTLLGSNPIPQPSLVPYFDQLESSGVVANKFAFYTLRSFVSYRAGTDQAATAADPLNNGIFVLGGGEEQTDLYNGNFVIVDVLHDLYYNTNLKSVRVDGCPAVAAAPLQPQYVQDAISNSIVDSGTSDLTLAQDVYDAILAGLKQRDPAFSQAVQASLAAAEQNQGVPAASLNLANWPNIYFTLAGENGEDIELTCAPQTYWQVDFPAAGQAMFQISGPLQTTQNPVPNQSILGLPLLNNYYAVFDRSEDTQGVIRFAPIKPPPGV
ncbi:MAG: pepsin-like aspartic protease [Acetobacteraceae bacterium]|jgi:hypothetical protein